MKSEKKIDKNYSIHELNIPMALIEHDTVENGDIYKAKIYLDKKTIRTSNRAKTIFKYSLNETLPYKIINDGIQIPVICDTGFLEFKVKCNSLYEDQVEEKLWRASMTFPLENKDTTFLIEWKYFIKNKE